MTEEDPASQCLLEAFRSFLRRDGWPLAAEDDDERASAIAVESEHGRWLCVAQVPADRAIAMFSSVLPVFVPTSNRHAVGEYLHRANCGLLLGGFQFDLDEGEVRYVTSVDLTGTDVDVLRGSGAVDTALHKVVYANLATVDQYLPGLMTIIYGDTSPEEAIALAEG